MAETSAPPAPLEHRFPCTNCGADYRFDPASGMLRCDHCGQTEPITVTTWESAGLRELDLERALSQELPAPELVEVRLVSCPNCGAQVEFAPDSHASECPFCATPVVTDTGAQRRIKPRGVLAFALDEPSARKAMTGWLGRLWFAPNGLREFARSGRRMQGVYVPYWTFDADTRSFYDGERGTVYYTTRTVTRNGRRVEERVANVRWSPASGTVTRFFDDVLVLASHSLPKRYTDALEPWDLGALAPYRPQYLAGFHAEGYTVDLGEGYGEARARMQQVIESDVRHDIGGDRQRVHRIETQISDATFKHVLLPVWMAAYKYRGKTYRLVVNGQSGRVQGERPWSVIKILFALLVGAILLGIFAYFGNQ
ncbi:TFIIB-type zinc finger domain-containing protein [Pontibaca methylaminivorans]|uniref:TFIIB-type zinc finger domain-containing protein n=1 Tax=Pontibaca methylaminivorans TaxID=515897 RepID=UPI002FDA834C